MFSNLSLVLASIGSVFAFICTCMIIYAQSKGIYSNDGSRTDTVIHIIMALSLSFSTSAFLSYIMDAIL